MTLPRSLSHPIGSLVPVLQMMAERDISEQQCLKGTGILASQFQDHRQTVSLQQEIRFYRNILGLSCDPAIGLAIGSAFPLARYGLFGYAMLAASTLRQAFVIASKFGDLTFTWLDLSYEVSGNSAAFLLTDRIAIDADVRSLLHDRDCSAAILAFGELQGKPYKPDRVGLPHDGHGLTQRYRAFFGCPVDFGCDAVRIELNSALLDKKLPLQNASALEHLFHQCQLMLSKLNQQSQLVDEIRRLLLARPGFFPDIHFVAERLGIAERSLRRRLAALDTSYLHILNELRYGLAREYLSETKLPLQEIALLLGYSEPSNFTHAFKRWAGMSPQMFRQAIDKPSATEAGL